MKLLTHVLAADARRFRLVIALWIAVVVAETAAQQLGTFVTPYTRESEAIATTGWLLWMSGVFVSGALVPLIVHLHPAVGSDAFWMTRPIPPGTLAATKLLLLAAVFIGVPLLIDQVVMAIYGVPGADKFRVMAQTMVFRGVVLAFLMAAAAMTPSLAFFVLLCGGVLFALAMVLPFVAVLLSLLASGGPSFSAGLESGPSFLRVLPPPSVPTAAVVAASVFMTGGVAAVVLQYRTRRVAVSAAVLAISVAVLLILANVWPSDAHAEGRPPEWADAPKALDLIAIASDLRADALPPLPDAPTAWSARVPVRMTPAAPGWLASARLQRASLELDTGVRFSMDSGGYDVVFSEPDGVLPEERALQHVLGVPHVANVASKKFRKATDLFVRLGRGHLPEPPPRAATFHGEFRVDLIRLEIVSAMPVGRGQYRDGAFRLETLDVRQRPTGVIVAGRTSNVATFLDSAPRPAYSYYLRNGSRKQAVAGVPAEHIEHLFLPFFGMSRRSDDASGFTVSAHAITFSDVGGERDSQFEMDRQWLDEAELVIVRATYDGSVRRRLILENFPVRATRAGS